MVEATNAQGSWAGAQLSGMTGQLERWRERDLHLYHNLVAEFTALRLQQTHMQDRINELIRQIDVLTERERALEALTVAKRGEDGNDERSLNPLKCPSVVGFHGLPQGGRGPYNVSIPPPPR